MWKHHFWKAPPGEEDHVHDPTSIEMIFDGPAWRQDPHAQLRLVPSRVECRPNGKR